MTHGVVLEFGCTLAKDIGFNNLLTSNESSFGGSVAQAMFCSAVEVVSGRAIDAGKTAKFAEITLLRAHNYQECMTEQCHQLVLYVCQPG